MRPDGLSLSFGKKGRRGYQQCLTDRSLTAISSSVVAEPEHRLMMSPWLVAAAIVKVEIELPNYDPGLFGFVSCNVSAPAEGLTAAVAAFKTHVILNP